MNDQNKISTTLDYTLYADSEYKEHSLSKLEIILDDDRNSGFEKFNDICDEFLEYGGNYQIHISIARH